MAAAHMRVGMCKGMVSVAKGCMCLARLKTTDYGNLLLPSMKAKAVLISKVGF